MKLEIEPFLLDNTLMNLCVYRLAAAWMGIRIRTVPTACVSLVGACYALLSLHWLPQLREPYWKLPCFLLLSVPLFRRAGGMIKAIPFILFSAALTGGFTILLTLQFGGKVYADGTVVGTVPVRAALLSGVIASFLPQMIRRMLGIRRRHALYTEAVIRLSTHTYRCKALIDSGNLLKEPISGLPVILINHDVDRPLRPIPFRKLSGNGILYGEHPVSVSLLQFGNIEADCYCAKSPERIAHADAILPEILLPNDWRIQDDNVAVSYLVSPARTASHWQTQYLMVRSCKRRTSAAARSGRRDKVHRACADRQGSEG